MLVALYSIIFYCPVLARCDDNDDHQSYLGLQQTRFVGECVLPCFTRREISGELILKTRERGGGGFRAESGRGRERDRLRNYESKVIF